MPKGMLGKLPLSAWQGPRDALEEKIAGEDGELWLTAFKLFLRKENPWEQPALSPSSDTKEHRIDCSVQPMIPEGWRIDPEDQIVSRFQGQFVWSPEKIRLYLDPGQTSTDWLRGEDLKKKLGGQPVLPVNILDYLLEHQDLIPEEWKEKAVFFWGTIYRDSGGNACVRCLYWRGRRWYWDDGWLGSDWFSGRPAAVLAG